MSDQVDWEAAIGELKARRDRLSITIATIEREVLGRTPSEAGGELPLPPKPTLSANGNGASGRETATVAINSDTFFKMSLPDAAKKYLSMVKRPAGAKQIEEALREGGFQTKSSHFYANIYTSLLRNPDTFEKVGKKWGLVEWYSQGGGRAKSSDAEESG